MRWRLVMLPADCVVMSATSLFYALRATDGHGGVRCIDPASLCVASVTARRPAKMCHFGSVRETLSLPRPVIVGQRHTLCLSSETCTPPPMSIVAGRARYGRG